MTPQGRLGFTATIDLKTGFARHESSTRNTGPCTTYYVQYKTSTKEVLTDVAHVDDESRHEAEVLLL